MDYQKIYNQIIKRAKNRKLEGYKEKHHIIPKCLEGSNEEENLIELTAREHFLCHLLLCEIYPKELKLKQALWLMAIGKGKFKENKFKTNNRTYERLKLEFSQIMKKQKIRLGKKASQETKNKMSKAHLGKKDTKEAKLNKSKAALGKVKTKEHRKNLSKSLIKSRGRIILQKDLQGNLIKEWEYGKKAAIELNLSYSSINNCCRFNEQKLIRKRDIFKIGKYTSCGYIWEYKN